MRDFLKRINRSWLQGMKGFIILTALLIASLQAIDLSKASIQKEYKHHQKPYTAKAFPHWLDEDKDGQDTRMEVLARDSKEAIDITTLKEDGRKRRLIRGRWTCAYTGKTFTNADQVAVIHVVPLEEAWESGAWNWTPQRRQLFANDLDSHVTLIVVDKNIPEERGARDPSEWVPRPYTNRNHQKAYVKRWCQVKLRWDLSWDAAEMKATQEYMNGKMTIHGADIYYGQIYKRHENGKSFGGILDREVTLPVGGTNYTFKHYFRIDYRDGAVIEGYVTNRIMLNGLHYPFDLVGFDKKGTIRTGYLTDAVNVTVGGTDYLLRGILRFYAGGALLSGDLVRPMEVSIHGNDYVLRRIQFYNNGMARGGTFVEPTTIALHKAEYLFSEAYFHDNGIVDYGVLERGFRMQLYNGTYAFRDSWVSFHKNGMVKTGGFSTDTPMSIKNVTYVFSRYYATAFHDNGRLQKGYLGADVSVDLGGISYTFVRGGAIVFTREGVLIQGQIVQPYAGWVRWYRDGTLASTPQETQQIEGWTGERP